VENAIDSRLRELKAAGYKIDYDAHGYMVWHGSRFVRGATVALPRSKPLHWRHRRANLRDNAGYSVNAAEYDLRACQARGLA
jgi:hypothetical protein